MKLNGPNILMGLSVAAAALAAVGTTFSVAELADIAPVNIAQVPFPVASAIILPPCLKPNIESIRSGTVMKAKDPARAIMRGTAMTISLDKGPIMEVVLDIAIIVNLDRSSRVMCLNDWDQASSRTATAISRSSRCMRVLVDYSSANIMAESSFHVLAAVKRTGRELKLISSMACYAVRRNCRHFLALHGNPVGSST